jgi:hypothetical protein
MEDSIDRDYARCAGEYTNITNIIGNKNFNAQISAAKKKKKKKRKKKKEKARSKQKEIKRRRLL